jgi:hypothetical protein
MSHDDNNDCDHDDDNNDCDEDGDSNSCDGHEKKGDCDDVEERCLPVVLLIFTSYPLALLINAIIMPNEMQEKPPERSLPQQLTMLTLMKTMSFTTIETWNHSNNNIQVFNVNFIHHIILYDIIAINSRGRFIIYLSSRNGLIRKPISQEFGKFQMRHGKSHSARIE